MNGRNEHRSVWERLDDNRPCGHRFEERTRWRVGSFAQELRDGQHELSGQILAEEADAFLRLVDRQRSARAEGWHFGGEPGE